MALESVKRNGHNLDLGRFETVGAYGIPRLYPIHLDERIEWIRFNHALKEQSRSRLGVHFSLMITCSCGCGTTLSDMPCFCGASGPS